MKRALAFALVGCTTGHESAPPAPPSPPAPAPAPAIAVPADAARKPKTIEIGLAHPMPCPTIPAPQHDPKLLVARGALANLAVDLDGFLRADVEVPEAVAALGPIVKCDGRFQPRSAEYVLDPTLEAVQVIELEVHDDLLAGVEVMIDPPAVVDMTALRRKFGDKGREVSPPEDSFDPVGEMFEAKTPDFEATFSFSHRDHADTDTAWHVHEVIFRRSEPSVSLPEAYRALGDVAHLIAHALQRHPAYPADFRYLLEHHAFAKLDVDDARDAVHAVRATFKSPIAATPDALAAATGALLHVPATASGATIDVAGRGTVTLGLAKGAVTSIEIVRR
jgi:hypothetical protein